MSEYSEWCDSASGYHAHAYGYDKDGNWVSVAFPVDVDHTPNDEMERMAQEAFEKEYGE